MPVFLARLLARLGPLRGWGAPVAVILFVFGTSWPLMVLAEGAGSEIVHPGNYWWYFVVTASTVGYGDLYPATVPGHLVGVYVIVGGIATLTTVFTSLAEKLGEAKGRRMQGAITVDASDHVLLIGYTPGRTERMVEQLLADDSGRIVLCAPPEVTTHPMPDTEVEFVRGEPTDAAVLDRAGLRRAGAVLVDVADDNEALAVVVTVDHLRTAAHVVVALRDMARAQQVGYVSPALHCVQWHTPRMITEELQSPGISEVYVELMTHGGVNTYSLPLPAAMSTGECRTLLGRRHAATLLAARTTEGLLVSPGWEVTLPAGTQLYYVAEAPIPLDTLRP